MLWKRREKLVYYANAEQAEIDDFDEWATGMRMSDEEFYREARPTFTSTENMQIVMASEGREGVLNRVLRRRYTPRHAKPLY